MNKYYSQNKTEMRHTSGPIEEYHRQRDELIGRKADHLRAPATYTRGAVPREDKRGRKTSFARRVALAILFLALWLFVFLRGLMRWGLLG